jgi:hypothetical protein
LAAMGVNAAEKEMIRKSSVFAKESDAKLQKAVAGADAGKKHIFFAQPQFQDNNVIFASHPLVFGINDNLSPQDKMIVSRFKSCDIASKHTCGGSKRTGEAFCKRASTGHPNGEGATRYAAAIINTGALTI